MKEKYIGILEHSSTPAWLRRPSTSPAFLMNILLPLATAKVPISHDEHYCRRRGSSPACGVLGIRKLSQVYSNHSHLPSGSQSRQALPKRVKPHSTLLSSLCHLDNRRASCQAPRLSSRAVEHGSRDLGKRKSGSFVPRRPSKPFLELVWMLIARAISLLLLADTGRRSSNSLVVS